MWATIASIAWIKTALCMPWANASRLRENVKDEEGNVERKE